eukprot:gene1106-2152_t
MSVQFKKRSAKASRPGLRVRKDEDDDENVPHGEHEHVEIASISEINVTNQVRTKGDEIGTPLCETVTTVYRSLRDTAPQSFSGDATHTSEIDTATDRDARAVLERNIKLNEEGILDDDPNVYRGQAGYKNFIKKDIAQVGSNKYTGTHGPIRAPTFVRNSARFDYQPDICKDYKETGFCGYGDQCKFLHDRGDYKSGWQLEREWDAEQLRKKRKLELSLANFGNDDNGEGRPGTGGGVDEEDKGDDEYAIPDEDEQLPFACFICREVFQQPVVTLCNHYFCSECALQNDKKNKRCAACGKQTFGVLNKAEKIIKRIAAAAVTGIGIDNVSVTDSRDQQSAIVKRESRRGQWEETS